MKMVAVLFMWLSVALRDEPAPFPASVPVEAVQGTVCRAAPMADGMYAAKHCNAWRLFIGGRTRPHSVDPLRDLMHFAYGADPSVVLRAPVDGERVRWRNDRAEGEGVVTNVRKGQFDFATTGGDLLRLNDSGTGLHGDDGALVGVLTDLFVRFVDKQPDGTGIAERVP